jgi:hypothetical protein
MLQEPREMDSGFRGQLRIVPPLSPSFILEFAGDQDIARRAQRWAATWRYVLLTGVAACAHGFYSFGMCPGHCYGRDLDHARMWAQPGDQSIPGSHTEVFLLSHLYDGLGPGAPAYADAHGVKIVETTAMDDWYLPGRVTAVRWCVPSSWPMWPVEQDLAVLMTACPIVWPDEIPDGLAERVPGARRT